MDRPAVDRIDGVLPAIAIDQTNPVRTSRSTVGTMTELNDHLKLLFARTAQLYCGGCGKRVQRDTAEGGGPPAGWPRRRARDGHRPGRHPQNPAPTPCVSCSPVRVTPASTARTAPTWRW